MLWVTKLYYKLVRLRLFRRKVINVNIYYLDFLVLILEYAYPVKSLNDYGFYTSFGSVDYPESSYVISYV